MSCGCPRANHKHGTAQTYKIHRCRCQPCTDAKARAEKKIRYRRYRGITYANPAADWRVPSTGTVLRLRALGCLGWTCREISDHTGVDRHQLDMIRNGHVDRVFPSTRNAVTRAYEQLWDKPATGPRSNGMRTIARRNGWQPPMMLDDDALDNPYVVHIDYKDTSEKLDHIAVEEAVAGRPVKLTKAERAEAIRQLRERGYSARQAAERLQISHRTVQRHSNKAA